MSSMVQPRVQMSFASAPVAKASSERRQAAISKSKRFPLIPDVCSFNSALLTARSKCNLQSRLRLALVYGQGKGAAISCIATPPNSDEALTKDKTYRNVYSSGLRTSVHLARTYFLTLHAFHRSLLYGFANTAARNSQLAHTG
eukprot:496776-Prorocentrum_minimum.AAC.1